MTNAIAQDLFQTIVEYTPIDDLKKLSLASPIFDIEICNAGIKIFCSGHEIYVLKRNSTIIQLSSGKKYLIKRESKVLCVVNDNCYPWSLLEMNIRHRDTLPNCFNLRYDPEHNAAIAYGNNMLTIVRNCQEKPRLYHAGHIGNHIKDKILGIDFNTKIVVSDSHYYADIDFEDFTVLYEDGLWNG